MLALDVGNGSVKWARFGDDGEIEATGRLAFDDDLGPLATGSRAVAVSVNPRGLARIRSALGRIEEIGVDVPLPLPVHYDPPEDCGPDRVVGAFGALTMRPAAEGVLLLDAGTCLTATVAVRGRGVVGGAILPGPELMAQALADGTARLPLVAPTPPPGPLGRSTADAIRAGIHAAVVGAARELIAGLAQELPEPLELVCAGTGGRALAASLGQPDAFAAHATLVGVRASCAPARPRS